MPDSLWDANKSDVNANAVARLSTMVNGADNLIQQPGLVLALYQGNATPQQASAIDQFVGGLNAEVAVRHAASSGVPINLSIQQKAALDAMGIDYSQVEQTKQDALSELTAKMAAKGFKPVLGPDGRPRTDANGNPLKQQIVQPKKSGGGGWFDSFGSFVHHMGNNPVTHFVTHGSFSMDQNGAFGDAGPAGGIVGAADVLNQGYQVINTTLSQAGQLDRGDYVGSAKAASGNADLAAKLGYNPDNVFSMLAFEAKGYAHNDTSALSDAWDSKHPTGVAGWDGEKAVTEAEAYGADPRAYMANALSDPALTPQEKADKVQFFGSDEFQTLVRQVNGRKADLGSDLATSIGLDPIKDSTRFGLVSGATNIAATFALDPLNFGLTAFNAARRASVTVKNLADAGEINRVFRPVDEALVTNEQSKQISWLHQMVTHGVAFREAMDAGDHVSGAAIKAGLDSGNPYAELLPDFSGFDQILSSETRHPFDITANKGGFKVDRLKEALGGLIGVSREGRVGVSHQLDDLEARLQLSMSDKAATPAILTELHDAIAEGRSLVTQAEKGGVTAETVAEYRAKLDSVERTLNAPEVTTAETKVKGKAGAYTVAPHGYKDYENVSKAKTAVKGVSPETRSGAKMLSDKEVLDRKVTEVPFVTGHAEPIRTYDEAVDYLASKGALMRLAGGRSMVESAMLPGALSSYGYKFLRGRLANWSVGISAQKAENTAEKWVLSLNEGEKAKALDEGWLTRAQANEGDAVDMLTGKRIAGTDVAITEAGRGMLRSNARRYGEAIAPATTAPGKVLSIYTLGAYERGKEAVQRFTNWLPSHTKINITSNSSVDTVKKIARTYMTPGDADMLAARYVAGNAETRKTIYQGVWEQTMHAAGLGRTSAGRDLLAQRPWDEAYSNLDKDLLDNNGRAMGLVPGHMQTEFVLPNFGQIHQAASKIGLYEATMGRLLTRSAVDRLLGAWKISVLAKGTTYTRAAIESWLGAYAEGMFGHTAAAKAFMRENGMLHGAAGRTRVTEAMSKMIGFQQMSRWYTHVMAQRVPAEEADALLSMPDDIFQAILQEQTNHHFATSIDIGGTTEATEIANDGHIPRQVQYVDDGTTMHRTGYKLTDEIDSQRGAETYAKVLSTWVNDDPELARTILNHIETLRSQPEHMALQAAHDDATAEYEAALKKWRTAKGVATRKGQEFTDPKPVLNSHPPKIQTDTADLADVVAALDKSSMPRLSSYGRVYWDESGDEWTKFRATTPEEVALGKEQWAQKVVSEMAYLITGRNGVVQDKLVNHILEKGVAPDADWVLNKIKGINRPKALLQPTFMAESPKGSIADKADGLLDVAGKGYKYLVERPIQRNVTAPMFGSAYAKSKVALDGWKQSLIEGGLSEEAAEKVTRDMAVHQGWNRIARLVDDPHMKSQLDVVGRSFFAFSRATTMMLRRWSGIAWRNPEKARRLMLAAEAANHTGITYEDENGNRMFYIPGSGVAQEILFHVTSKLPGFEGLAQFPVQDLQGRVSTIIPGSDNPSQYTMNPLVAIPMREVASRFPHYREWFDEVDRTLNGDMGQGAGVLATMEPALIKAFTDPLSTDRDSMTTSAMVGSLYDLYATGQVPKDGAAPSDYDDFKSKLEVQTKSRLYVRAVLSTFSPAVLSLDNSFKSADAAFATAGVRGLKNEFNEIVNDLKGDYGQALQVWAALHPGELVYTQSMSQTTGAKTLLPATQASYKWMANHTDFIDKYKSVAGYFLPPEKAGETYSQEAYRAQLEQGIREKRTPKEFLDAVRISSAASPYYAMETQFNKEYAAAKAAGNTTLAASHKADWLAWSKNFKANHPTFGDSLTTSPTKVIAAKGQLADLRLMAQRGDVPGGPDVKLAVTNMIAAWDGYKSFLANHPGASAEAKAQRSSAFSELQDYYNTVVANVPDVAGIYNGVFHVLNNNLESGYS